MSSSVLTATAPMTRRVRAYCAPVNRTAGAATVWSGVGLAGWNVEAPAAGWVDLGWCAGFARTSGTKVAAVATGSPAMTVGQVRTAVEAEVSLELESWSKLGLALTAGMQQMNLLAEAAGAAANGSGGTAVAATALNVATSSATALDVGQGVGGFEVGDVVVVDVDYAGQTGFVGSGVSGGYVKSSAAVGTDVDYVRRVSLNVARVVSVTGTVLGLGGALVAGAPTAGMKVSKVMGFCDREGASYFQEWSGLFVVEGEQGDRVAFHYPRLQAMEGAAEAWGTLAGADGKAVEGLMTMRLKGRFRALPVTDANDGERVVCFRSYAPAAMRAV